MHKLSKGQAPSCLSKFHHGQNNWDDVTTEDKVEIWEKITDMQGTRCAYCESELQKNNKHIEHFRQKNSSIYPQGTFKWDNLFGSCNRTESCGKHKDSCGPYNYINLIKPDIEDPEYFFQFISDGTIAIRSSLLPQEKSRAKETLRIFNLDAERGALRQMRKNMVTGYIQTAETLLEIFDEFGEDEYHFCLKQELDAIKGVPFITAIKHVIEV